MTDRQAGDLSTLRNNGRFPTVTYVHRWGVNVGKGKGAGCAIWRSSEPIRELAFTRHDKDEVMIQAIAKVYGEKESASLYIFSSRSDGGSKANNIGFESSSIYPNI